MKLFLDNLFLLGQVITLAALAWGAWMVLRDSLAGIVFPSHKKSTPGTVHLERDKRPADRTVAIQARETRRAA